MALTQATLTVSFTSNYKGIHRICWRVKDSGDDYDCSLLTSCAGDGAECMFEIPIMVDPLVCGEPVIFEGYIQPICEPIESEETRTPFEIGYYPEDCPDIFPLQVPVMTAVQATALTPLNGMFIYVSDTDVTFITPGFWGYEENSWVKK